MSEEEDIYGDDDLGPPQHIQPSLPVSPREEQEEQELSAFTCFKLDRRRYHDFLVISHNCYKLIVDLAQSCNVEVGN